MFQILKAVLCSHYKRMIHLSVDLSLSIDVILKPVLKNGFLLDAFHRVEVRRSFASHQKDLTKGTTTYLSQDIVVLYLLLFFKMTHQHRLLGKPQVLPNFIAVPQQGSTSEVALIVATVSPRHFWRGRIGLVY